MESIIGALKSGNIELQVSALVEVRELVLKAVAEAIRQLPRSSNPYVLAERIYGFGTLVRPLLEEAFIENTDGPTKPLLAVSLVMLGSDRGTDLVVRTAASDGEYRSAAIVALAKGRVHKAEDVFFAILRDMDVGARMSRVSISHAQLCLEGLHLLHIKLPNDLMAKLSTGGVPEEIREHLKAVSE